MTMTLEASFKKTTTLIMNYSKGFYIERKNNILQDMRRNFITTSDKPWAIFRDSNEKMY